MTKERASIFDIADELDVSGFTPKPGPDPEAVPADRVRAIAEASRFPSRAGIAPAAPSSSVAASNRTVLTASTPWQTGRAGLSGKPSNGPMPRSNANRKGRGRG